MLRHNIYIYIYSKKITSSLKWSQNKINVLTCAWSECFAIASWYVLSNVKYELIKIRRRGGLQIYPIVLGVYPKLNLYGYPQGICGLNGVSGAIVHNAPRYDKDRRSEVTFQKFLLPLGILSP